MKRNDSVTFYWRLKSGKEQSISTTGAYFKNYAMQLLEEETIDKVIDVRYSYNGVVTKLDYYNFEQDIPRGLK